MSAAPTHPFKVGDIMVSEWGAPMQLVTFYRVSQINGKCQITIEEIQGIETPDGGFLTGTAKPRMPVVIVDRPREPATMRRRVKETTWRGAGKEEWYVRPTDYSSAYFYDPTKTYHTNHAD